MLLADLIQDVAIETGQSKTAVEAVVRRMLARIERAIGQGETVNLVGFGRFEVYQHSARRGRNLRTGESLKIPATKAVRFRIGKHLKDAAAGAVVGYEVLGTTKDGVKILKPMGRATHFTEKELREAIATVRSAQKAG